MAQILALIQMADAIAGSAAAQALLGYFTGKRSGLTDEQKANLTANYEDYVVRIAKLKAELGEG
jgi:hypothetical protein